MFAKLDHLTGFVLCSLALLAFSSGAAMSQSLVASGEFVAGEQPTTGSVKISKDSDGTHARFSGDFSTTPGPILKVVLHKQADPKSFSQDNYRSLGNLKNAQGAQTYAIPAGTDLKAYKSVAIWCSRYNVVFGLAKLRHH